LLYQQDLSNCNSQPALPLNWYSNLSERFPLGDKLKIQLSLALLTGLFGATKTYRVQTSPHIHMQKGSGQLIVNSQPFLILGGEIGNSSASIAARADLVIPNLAKMHVNTVLMPVAWTKSNRRKAVSTSASLIIG